MIRRLGALALALLLLATLALHTARERWQTTLVVPAGGYHLEVAPGQTLRGVAAMLQQDGVLRDPLLLRLYGRWTGLDQRLHQGEYRVPAGTDLSGLLDMLHRGDVIRYQVTLPEGITLAEALAILWRQPGLVRVLGGTDDDRLLALVAPARVAEGLFFPDSYYYVKGETDFDILLRAHQHMAKTLAQEWESRAPGLPLETPYEALILASIVERETGLVEEREQIAGVFVRRLQQGMRLQTDPTIIYGLGEDYDGNLRRAHLGDDSNPYNTYQHDGLPPSPIALPGRGALRAALHPADGEALFFVARGDGGHVFSATLEAHNRAVRKYQLQRRADYRSTPGNGD